MKNCRQEHFSSFESKKWMSLSWENKYFICLTEELIFLFFSPLLCESYMIKMIVNCHLSSEEMIKVNSCCEEERVEFRIGSVHKWVE